MKIYKKTALLHKINSYSTMMIILTTIIIGKDAQDIPLVGVVAVSVCIIGILALYEWALISRDMGLDDTSTSVTVFKYLLVFFMSIIGSFICYENSFYIGIWIIAITLFIEVIMAVLICYRYKIRNAIKRKIYKKGK